MTRPSVAIITTAHWPGDARLNRHVEHLEAAGIDALIMSFAGDSRRRSIVRALGAIVTVKASALILPDPEMFLIGSLLGRLRRRRVVIDIHEDYSAAASARGWVPSRLRGTVAWAVRMLVWLGRKAANAVVVAAPQLSKDGDTVVWNVPDPSSMAPGDEYDGTVLAYVGDITEARGAFEMLDLVHALGEPYRLLLIGRVDPRIRSRLDKAISHLGVSARVELTGRLEHAAAWDQAANALVGLNLLHPVPAYLDAVGTKLWEYFLVGLPPLVSDLPGQSRLVETVSPDLVVATTELAVGVVRRMAGDPNLRAEVARRGRKLAESQWASVRPDLRIQEAVAPLPITSTRAPDRRES